MGGTISDNNTRVLITIPKTLKADLELIAKAEKRSFSNLAYSVLEDYAWKHMYKNTPFVDTETGKIAMLVDHNGYIVASVMVPIYSKYFGRHVLTFEQNEELTKEIQIFQENKSDTN